MRKARCALHQAGRDQGQLSRAADPAADRRRRPGILRQPVGRHLLGRHHGAVPRDRRALYRHRHRAVARLLFRLSKAPEARSNYALRETLAAKHKRPGGTTAVSTCGANPGMVSWFVKQALLDIARDLKPTPPKPKTKAEWADRCGKLGVKGIHIAERDTQRSKKPKPMKCSSTPGRWKVSCPKACSRPNSAGARMKNGCPTTGAPTKAAAPRSICCSPAPTPACAPGARRRGAQYGFLVTHNESISIADYFTVRDARARRSTGRPATTPIIRPTTPCCRCTKSSAAPARCSLAAHPR